MKKKIWKAVALLLTAVIFISALCACSDDETSSDPEDVTSAVTADNSFDPENTDNTDNTFSVPSGYNGPSGSNTPGSTDNSAASLWNSTDLSSSVQRTSSMVSGNNQRTSSTASSGGKVTTSKSGSGSTSQKAVTLYVKDFGAVGNGVTDDGAAIYAAVQALRSSPAGSVLEFEKGKTYYYEDNGVTKTKDEMKYESETLGRKYVSVKKYPYLFYFNGDSDLKIKGNGCLVKMGAYDTTYMYIENSKNITIEGFNLDFAIKPAFSAELIGDISVNNSTKTATALVKADRDITLKNGEEYVAANERPGRAFFGTMPTSTSMYHFYIKKYEMVDRAARTVRVYFDTSKGQSGYFNMIPSHGLILPMPHNGFSMDGSPTDLSFTLISDTNLTFRNINVYSNKYQTFYIKHCEGTTTFENINFTRAPYDQNLKYSSWGDIYHPANNRSKLLLINCTNEQPFDDVFNITGVTLFVRKKRSDTVIELQAIDGWYNVPKVKVGDTITLIDKKTNALIGRPTVTRVVEQNVYSVAVQLSQSLASVDIGESPSPEDNRILAWDEDAVCAPDSEMIGCVMDGTFRARASMTFTDCRFHVRRFWIETTSVEGPIPHDLLFRNCDLTSDKDPDPLWLIRSGNKTNSSGFRIENVVFENCKGISWDIISKGPYDQITIK